MWSAGYCDPLREPEEFVGDSNGVLIPANDVHELSRAMQKMFTQAKAYDKIKLSEEYSRDLEKT